MQSTGDTALADLPDELFGQDKSPVPALVPQWALDGKGAPFAGAGRGASAKPRQAEDRPWRGHEDRGRDTWLGGGSALAGPRAAPGPPVGPRWREEDRPVGPPPRRDARWGGTDSEPTRWMENTPGRGPQDAGILGTSPGERWGDHFGRGRGRAGPAGPPTPVPTPPRWGAPERHQHPERWGGPFPPEAGAQRERGGKWDKWGGDSGAKDQHVAHEEKWRPPHGGHATGAFESRGDPLAAGRGRGFAIGRGRGLPGHAQAPGADRWNPHSHPPLTDPMSPDQRSASKATSGNLEANGKHWPKSSMIAVYEKLQSANRLRLPASVNKEDASLFAVSGQPSVPEVLSGLHDKLPPASQSAFDGFPTPHRDQAQPERPAATQQDTGAQRSTSQHQSMPGGSALSDNASAAASKLGDQTYNSDKSQPQQPMPSPFATALDEPAAHHEHVQDAWVYRDPNWQIQGPFPKADILDWFEGGFFPADLPIRHAGNPHADFKPLAAQIKVWAAAAPPGFAQPAAAPPTPAQSSPAPTEQHPSAQQQPLAEQRPSGHAQSNLSARQSNNDIDRTYTLTSANSYPHPAGNPTTASSAKLDALETGLSFNSGAPQSGHAQYNGQQPQQQQRQQQQQQPNLSGTPDIIMQLLNASSTPSPAPTAALSGLQGLGENALAHFSGRQSAAPSLNSWGLPGGSAVSSRPTPSAADGSAGLFGHHGLQPAPQQHALPSSLFPTGANQAGHQPSHAPTSDVFAQLLGSQQQARPAQNAQQAMPIPTWGKPPNQHQHMLSEAQILQPHLSGQLSDSGLGRSPQEDFQRLLSQAASPHRRQQQQYQPDRQSSKHDSALADLNLGKSRSGQTQSDAIVAPPAPPSRQAPDTSPAQKENKIAPAKRKQSQPQPGVKGNAPSQTQQNALEVATGPAWGAPEHQRAQSLAGVQQEQQQQQQEQQHDLSWDTPAPQPAMSKPAELRAAPWAGVKPPLPAAGRSLMDIQKDEEARAAARAAAQPVISDVKSPAPGRAGHWGAAAGPAIKSGGQAKSLMEIQEEEQRAKQSSVRQQQHQQQQQNAEPAPGGFTLRDAFTDDRTGPLLSSKPAWAGSGGRHPSEESAADLEGGNSTSYDTFVQPPPPPPRAKPAKEVKKTAKELQREKMEEQRRAAEAARQELKEERKPKQGPAGPAPSMALRTAASLQRALSNTDDDGMFWDYGGLATAQRLGNGTAAPAAQSKPTLNGRSAAAPVQQWQSAQPAPPVQDPTPSSDTAKMTPEFKSWAMQQIRTLSKLQIEDPSILLDILMDLPSDGEVVEACLVNIGRSGAVSAFATEFIRRKATDSSGTKKGKGKATPAAPPSIPVPAAAPALAAAPSAADANKFQKVPKAAKGKKGKAGKGQKLDSSLLGFQNKLDFAVLERGDDYA